MAWKGVVKNESGVFTAGYPGRGPTNNPFDGITDWNDPVIPNLATCQYACGGSGFFSGDDAKDATRWDGLMLYIGKIRNWPNSGFWRQILYSDSIFSTWVQRDDVKTALTALLYAECIGPVPPGENYKQLSARANTIALSKQPNSVEAMTVVFMNEFFDTANTDPSFIKKTIYRSLSSVPNTEQCKKSGKEWPGNTAICWLCNQNITNIYMGGLSTNIPTYVKIKGVDMVINPVPPKTLIGVDTDDTNPTLSTRSVHNKECEHVLPYIVGSYILKLFGGNNVIKEALAKAQANKMIKAKHVPPGTKAKDLWPQIYSQYPDVIAAEAWQNLEYQWSHHYCNQIKSQGHFLDYDEQTGYFGIDYVQVANFSKRLRCQGNYRAEDYTDTQKECRITTDKGTLRERTWKNFTDETDEILYNDGAKNSLVGKPIRTVCNLLTGESCRSSFITPSDIPGINDNDSDANKYLKAKGYPLQHTWMKDTDGIISTMSVIVQQLNSPANAKDPAAPNLPIGLLSLIRARISSFIIAKYLEDVAKQLQAAPSAGINYIWGTALPNPWSATDEFRFSPTGGDTIGMASKFVFGLARCCEAAIKSNRVADDGSPPTSIELQSWLDGCIHSSNSAYMSLSRIEKIKGDETVFGRVLTRAYKKAAILMANPKFVIPLLNILNKILLDQGTPLLGSGETGYQLKADWKTTIEQFAKYIVDSLRSSDIIYTQLGAIAESIIPYITTGITTFDGRQYNSQWRNVSKVITEQIQNFIPNLYYYSNPIAPLSENEIAKISSYDSNAYARDAFNGYSAAANKIDWLEQEGIFEFMLESDNSVIDSFWSYVFSNFQGFLTDIQNSGGFTEEQTILYISDYLKDYVNNEDVLDKFLSRFATLEKRQVIRQSRRLRGLAPENDGQFGKVKSRGKPRAKPRGKPKRKPRSKSSDTNLKNKLKMVGIKVTKMVKGKRVSLTKKELQKRISAFKKLQAKAKKLKVSLKYKSTSGRYKFKSRRRLISDIKKARKNTKRKNTKRKNTKRKNTKRKNTKRKNTKRKN
jgi:hypothetical protein